MSPLSFGQAFIAVTIMLAAMLVAGCTLNEYEKGEGEYSLMTAEMVMAHVGSDKKVDMVITDQDERLVSEPAIEVKWMSKADSVYRALMHYNIVGNGKAEPVSMSRVGVLLPSVKDSLKEGMKTDPLHLESMWMSKNKQFINMRLRLMTGATDDQDAIQMLGIAVDSMPKKTPHLRMQLYHNQGGQPEYYSATSFVSIPTEILGTDSVTITVNTYEGVKEKTFVLPSFSR